MRTISKVLYLLIGIAIVALGVVALIAALAFVGNGYFDDLIVEFNSKLGQYFTLTRDIIKYVAIGISALYILTGALCVLSFVSICRGTDKKSLHISMLVFGILTGNIWIIIAGATGIVGYNRQ